MTGHKLLLLELLLFEIRPVTLPLAVSAPLKNDCSRTKKNTATARKIPPIQGNLLIDNMTFS